MENITLVASKGPAMTIFDGFQVTLKNMNLKGEDEPLMIKGSEGGALNIDLSASEIQFGDEVRSKVIQNVRE